MNVFMQVAQCSTNCKSTAAFSINLPAPSTYQKLERTLRDSGKQTAVFLILSFCLRHFWGKHPAAGVTAASDRP